eukprot:gnl/TRDRNA2_/TRDRNA2_156908_c0_seq1.p1 gnl/TRDRNA2_/TRDRNA2_156908_c0~~gnl/TRDRNA2_/TRDRNA2_156908_c0_seq1.p1  ORF type:complete len:306 (+),score=40.55 gnl/TRDRNA2_/TRDRNA2_156908_c0_seq1:119-919(+)
MNDAPILVTGATGRTGSIIYNVLKHQQVAVRGLVRNTTKARELLGCMRCDESEGIFVGDVTKPETLVAPMNGTGALVIAVGPECKGPYPAHCVFPKGAYPIDIDWHGGKSQIAAFAKYSVSKSVGHVVLISTMETTEPEFVGMTKTLEYIHFYKLNLEAHLMASGLPFTVVKPCMFSDGPPGTAKLLVGHDDAMKSLKNVSEVRRSDLARVAVAAVQNPVLASRLRFDLCSQAGGPPTTDAEVEALLRSAVYPWNQAEVGEHHFLV